MSEQATYTEHVYQEYSCGDMCEPIYQLEEIVRCRDCVDFERWDYVDGSTRNVCARFEYLDVTPDGFCAWAERREQ